MVTLASSYNRSSCLAAPGGSHPHPSTASSSSTHALASMSTSSHISSTGPYLAAMKDKPMPHQPSMLRATTAIEMSEQQRALLLKQKSLLLDDFWSPPAVIAPTIPPDDQTRSSASRQQNFDASVASSAHSSPPISLPLPILKTMTVESALYSNAVRDSTQRLQDRNVMWRNLLAFVDHVLPLSAQALIKRSDSRTDPASFAATSVDPVDDSFFTGTTASASSTLDLTSLCDLMTMNSFSGLTCADFAQHVCVWRWRGSVMALFALSVLSIFISIIMKANDLPFFAYLYSFINLISFTALFVPPLLNKTQACRYLHAFPHALIYSVFALVIVHSLHSGANSAIITVAGCSAVVAISAFTLGFYKGLQLYFASLLLMAMTYARSLIHFQSHSQWWLGLPRLTNNTLTFSYAEAELFIVLAPALFTMLCIIIVTILYWYEHSKRLLKRSIQQQQQLKDAAITASKLKSDFLSTVSHDLRTPMASILGFVQLALGDPALGDETRECLNTAFTSAEDLLVLLNDVLDVGRIEAGHLRFESIAFDLLSVFEKSVRTFAGSSQKKGVELIIDFDPQLYASATNRRVIGDPSRLSQILNNLLSNSVKFCGNNGKSQSGVFEQNEIVVRVSLLPPLRPGYAHILTSVADSGEGISKDGLERIFRPFQQANDTVSRRHGGSGLGLHISQELVRLSGGRIWCSSAIGQGSVFSFTSQFALENQAQDVDFEPVSDFTYSPPHPYLSPERDGAVIKAPNAMQLKHARSAPTPAALRSFNPASAPVQQLRVLMAIHNSINAQVLARIISLWSDKEFADCSVAKPCAKCLISFNYASQSPSHQLIAADSSSPSISPSTPLPFSDASSSSSSSSSAASSSSTPIRASSPNPPQNHKSQIEIMPQQSVTCESVVHELQWARTVRQPYDLLVLDESIPTLDTVKVISSIQSNGLVQQMRPGVLILTSRLLTPILRGNGSSTYVLISKPVLMSDLTKALQLLLRNTGGGPSVASVSSASMPILARSLTPSSYAPRLDQERQQSPAASESSAALACISPAADQASVDTSAQGEKEDTSPLTASFDSTLSPAGRLLRSLRDSVDTEDEQQLDSSRQSSSNLFRSSSEVTDDDDVALSSAACSSASISDSSNSSVPLSASISSSSSFPSATFTLPPYLKDHLSQLPLLPPAPAPLWHDRSHSDHISSSCQREKVETTLRQRLSRPRSKSMSKNFYRTSCVTSMQSFPSPALSSTSCATTCSLQDSEHSSLHSRNGSPRSSQSCTPPFQQQRSLQAGPGRRSYTSSKRASESALAPSSSSNPESPSSGTASPAPMTLLQLRATQSSRLPTRRLLPSSHAAEQSADGLQLPVLQLRSLPASNPMLFDMSTEPSCASASSYSSPRTPSSAAAILCDTSVPGSAVGSPLSLASPFLSFASPASFSDSSPQRLRGGKATHVLCVDDTKTNLKLASMMLERMGYVCHTASSAEEAIDVLVNARKAFHALLASRRSESEYPELLRGQSASEERKKDSDVDPEQWIVMMDVQLGKGLDGHEATRRLRSLGFAMPIYAFTGNCSPSDKEKCLAAGMQGLLPKPLRMETLDSTLKQAILAINESFRISR